MSHVNAEKIAASQIKSVAGAGMAKMTVPATVKMGMGPMMHESMSSMMMEGMKPMMNSPGVVSGVAASVGSSAGKSVIRKALTHPLVFFSLGVVAGYYVYKYRKSIIKPSDEIE